jgi:hypothetical protein
MTPTASPISEAPKVPISSASRLIASPLIIALSSPWLAC